SFRRSSLPTLCESKLARAVVCRFDVLDWFTLLMPAHGKKHHQHDDENNSHEDPSEDLPGPRRRKAALAAQLVSTAAAMGDVDRLEVSRAAQRAAALAARRSLGRAGVATRFRRRGGTRPIGMAALRTRFRLGRNLSATGRTSDERHCVLRS